MAGLFIEKGPVVQVKGRFGRPHVLDDRDPSVHYDGPLVVLVNSSSASASEIMAAAMQDYKRGIVAGTPTFGKGTVQRFYNLDNFLRGDGNGVKPLGAIKLTTQKFYRINGDATQLKGVTPDVVLPDAYTYIDRGEKEQEYSMPWDEIEAVGYWHVADRQWIHAPCQPNGACPLLAVAAEALLPDPTAPVICYCASGKRASVAQAFLQERGYTHVLNAGGYPGDFGDLLEDES